MTFVDLIIERHACDQAMKRALVHFNARRSRRAVGIFDALRHRRAIGIYDAEVCGRLSDCAMRTIGHG